jgi:hypothetical protein
MVGTFLALNRFERRDVCEAAALTIFVAAAVRALGFLRLRRTLQRIVALTRIDESRRPSPAGLKSVARAVAGVGARAPFATCLVQALVAEAMLRRRGIPCELRFGVRARTSGDLPIEGHAWAECLDGTIVGAAHHQSDFKTLCEARV